MKKVGTSGRGIVIKPPIPHAYVNGVITPSDKATISVFDRGLVLGDGLFETLRAVDFQPQFFSRHYRRLKRSAQRLLIPLPLKEAELVSLITGLCRKSRLPDAAVRITLTRGRYEGTLSIDPKAPPSLIVTVSPVSVPPRLYEDGVKVAISSINKAAASGLDPRIKSTNYLANIFAKAEGDRKGCYESILLGPEGEIAELSTASFFCVLGGKILTPSIETGILPGITREVILALLRRKRLPFAEARIMPSSVPEMSEAFLSSSVRGIVPITHIERKPVGDAKVGPVFRRLRELYVHECESDCLRSRP